MTANAANQNVLTLLNEWRSHWAAYNGTKMVALCDAAIAEVRRLSARVAELEGLLEEARRWLAEEGCTAANIQSITVTLAGGHPPRRQPTPLKERKDE